MSRDKGIITLRIAGLSEGVHEYAFSCRAADFKNPELGDPCFCSDIHVSAVARKTESEITVDIETGTVVDLSCDICLEPLKKELSGSYRIFFVFGGSDAGEEDENYRILDRNASEIDLTEDVRETLLLSKPIKTVCTGNPQCAVYHEDENGTDEKPKESMSRWRESLEQLKNKYH